MTTRLLFFALFAVALAAEPNEAPYLFFRLVTPHGFVTLAPGRPARVPNNERIPLQICVKAATVADAFEPPSIAAVNQPPDYFEFRPPANITLSLRKITASGLQEVPFRVTSSGGGKDLTVQFVEWMLTQAPEDSHSQLLRDPAGRSRLVAYFEEQYINNPAGDYEIIARYAPTTPENWKGSLVSAPFRIQVIDKGDFFDALRAKLGPAAGR